MKIDNAIQVELTADEINTILSNYIKQEMNMTGTDVDKRFTFNYEIDAKQVISGDDYIMDTRLISVRATWREKK